MSVSELRNKLRELTESDPLVSRETPLPDDGSIQVHEGAGEIKSHHRKYADNGFGNPIEVADNIVKLEDIKPALEISKDKISDHRMKLKELLKTK